jgi:hypothetical protein
VRLWDWGRAPANVAVKEAVDKFVVENQRKKTLVLIDPSGTVKTDLLDNMFHRRVLAPAMTSLSLEGSISKLLVLVEPLGLAQIARFIGEALKPSLFEFLQRISRT